MTTVLVLLIIISISAAGIGDAQILETIKLHGCRLTCAMVGAAVITGSTLLDVDVAKPPTGNMLRSVAQIHQARPLQ